MMKGQLGARKAMSRHEWTATMWKPIRLVSTWRKKEGRRERERREERKTQTSTLPLSGT